MLSHHKTRGVGVLTFSISVTLDGCVDHQKGLADDETHAFFTRVMEESGAMLLGPRHLRDDGELLASGRSRRRGGAACDARLGGQAGGQTGVGGVVDTIGLPVEQ